MTLNINIDITDWQEEAERDENFIMSEEDILTAIRQGIPSIKAARILIVSQELGLTKERISRPNKVLLNVGAQADAIAVIHKAKTKVRVANGAEYNVNELVGYTPEKADENSDEPIEKEVYTGPSFFDIHDKRSLESAIRYMENIIPGYIWGRLIVIYENGGDVRNEAEKLKQAIDEMINRIV